MIDFPSGVSSEAEDNIHASIKLRLSKPSTGKKSVALRLPIVMVPVLSSRSVSTSPAVSTALPDLVITFARSARSIPAIPIAESKPPIVVGIRQTKSERNAAIVITVLE